MSTSTSGVFLDIAKAFDRVWHERLIFKLIRLEIPSIIIKLIRSFLENRKIYCSVNQEKSAIKSILAGVPQGSILGPTLYNLFVHEMPKQNDTILAMYADDTAILSGSPRVCTYHNQENTKTHL